MTLNKGDWSGKDNKHYRRHFDRIYVSETEEWEVEYFIDHYLKTHGYDTSQQRREAILWAISEYPGRKPILRTQLTASLEKKCPPPGSKSPSR
ncbi:hypothetical protein [Cupriavidus sp. 8B]